MPLWRYTWNTLLYAGARDVGVVLSSVPVAYALSRMSWRGAAASFLLVVLVHADAPGAGDHRAAVRDLRPKLHWIGSLKPLIVPAFFGDAFSIFLLRQFFLTIPQELSDAARVDGAGEFQIMTRVIVPLAKPAHRGGRRSSSSCTLERLLQSALVRRQQPGLVDARRRPRSSCRRRSISACCGTSQMAASVLFMLPVIVLFFLAQRVFIEGVTLTGVKG